MKQSLYAYSLLSLLGSFSLYGACNSDYSICSWAQMPLYNQRLISDNHCVPTAASMGLANILVQGETPINDSWTRNSFLNTSSTERIQNFGTLMSTDSANGTGILGTLKYVSRRDDFQSVDSNIDLPILTTFSSDRLRSRMLEGLSDVLVYGHYEKKCRKILFADVCTYARQGGHAITVSGATVQNGVIKLQFNDPWNGVVKEYRTTQVPAATWDFRPFSFQTYMLYRDGNQHKIIDTVVGLKLVD